MNYHSFADNTEKKLISLISLSGSNRYCSLCFDLLLHFILKNNLLLPTTISKGNLLNYLPVRAVIIQRHLF